MFGPSGLLALPMMTMKTSVTGAAQPLIGMSIYLAGLLLSYASGFFFMKLIGTKGLDLS